MQSTDPGGFPPGSVNSRPGDTSTWSPQQDRSADLVARWSGVESPPTGRVSSPRERSPRRGRSAPGHLQGPGQTTKHYGTTSFLQYRPSWHIGDSFGGFGVPLQLGWRRNACRPRHRLMVLPAAHILVVGRQSGVASPLGAHPAAFVCLLGPSSGHMSQRTHGPKNRRAWRLRQPERLLADLRRREP